MRKFVISTVGALLVGGCAIPVPLQIASWALDGISLLATQKSVADHGLSILAQKDCAVWRGMTVGELCRNAISGDTMVADDAVKSPTKSGLTKTLSFGPSFVNSLASLSNDKNESAQLSSLPYIQPQALRLTPNKAVTVVYRKSISPIKSKSIQIAEIITPIIDLPVNEVSQSKRDTLSVEPAKGIYFVVGSFRIANNAQRLLASIAKLAPSILNAKSEGSVVYRVVVGPVISGSEKKLHQSLARNGFEDTWAIRIEPSEWRFSNLPKIPSKTSLELATLQK